MADVQRTIEIIFGAVDETGSTVSSIGNNITKLSDGVKGATQPLADATSFVLKLEAAIAGLGAVALGFAFNEAVKFQSATLDLQKVLSDGEGSASDFTDQIDALSDKFGVSGSEIVGSAADFKQANFTIAESFELVAAALAAANTSELNVAQSSELLKGILSGFNAPASEVTRLLDVLTTTSNTANTNVTELATGMSILSPIANQLGLDFAETAGFLVPLIENNITGSESATALKTSFLRLINPTKEAREGFDALGIAQRGINGEFLTGLPLLESLQAGVKGLDGEQVLLVSSLAAGKNQAAKFALALTATERQVEVTSKAIEDQGSTVKELNVRLQATEVTINRFKAAMQSAAVATGEQFRVNADDAIESTTSLLQAFRDLVREGGLEKLFAALRPLIDDFSSTIDTITKNLPEAFAGLNFDRLVESFGNVGGAISNIFGGLDLTTAEGLQDALQQIIDLGASLIDLTAGIVSGFAPLIDQLVNAAGGFGELSASSAEIIGQILGFGTALNTVAPLVGSLGSAISSLGDVLVVFASVKILTSVTSVTALTGSLTTLATVLGKGGLLGAVGAASFALGTLATQTSVGQSAVNSLSQLMSDLAGDTAAAEEALGKMVFTQDDFQKSTVALVGDVEKQAVAQAEVLKGFDDLGASGKNLAEVYAEAGFVFNSVTGEVVSLAEVNEDLAKTQKTAEESAQGFVKSMVDGIPTFTQFGKVGVESVTDVGDATKKTREEAAALELKLLELASNEKIASIEAVVNLNVAQVEADTERITVAFEALNNTITSTGDVIGSALGAVGDVGGFFGLEQLEIIENQLEKENDLRREAADLQRKQVEATIGEIRARTQALQDGDGIISIDTSGLEPALELIFTQIIEKTQVRASEQGQAFLLGLT